MWDVMERNVVQSPLGTRLQADLMRWWSEAIPPGPTQVPLQCNPFMGEKEKGKGKREGGRGRERGGGRMGRRGAFFS